MSERTKLSHKSNVNKEVLLEVPTEQVEMTLNTESKLAMQLIMQRLTALYDNPIEASVRETVSNGLDALSEAHSGLRPEIKISTPNNLHPVLVIKDNGIGMSYEDLKNVYAKYGASTKGDNLEQVGAYGLGAKSPLAYGNEFTVTSVKGDERTTIIVAREEMTNYIKIVETGKTTEPTGTTVSIPVSTSDISEFSREVYKYTNGPMDNDVDLYINEQLITYEDFSLLTDSLLIHAGKEDTYGRVWVRNDSLVELMTQMSSSGSIQEEVRLLIGGWLYKTPSHRKEDIYRNKTHASLFVELKPGIVDFNSSRDVVQDDDKSDALVEHIVDYVESSTYTQDLIKVINSLEINEFKKVASTLLEEQLGNVSIINKKGQFVEGNHSYRSTVRHFYFEDMTHKETGFNLDTIFASTPKVNKPSIVLSERLHSYKKTSENSLMSETLNSGNSTAIRYESITNINTYIDTTFIARRRTSNMSDLITKLITLMTKKTSLVTFVTNVKEDNVKYIKANRKVIYRVGAKGVDARDLDSYLVYTEHSKEEITTMIEASGFKGTSVNVSIYTVNEIEKEVKAFRKLTASKKAAAPKGLSTRLYVLNEKNTRLENSDISNLDDEDTNLIIMSKDRTNSSAELLMIKKWYVNENKVDKDTVKVYASVGFHKVKDLKVLAEVGVVMRGTSTESVGRSELYFNDFHDNVAEMNALYNDSNEVEEQAFIRTLTGSIGVGPKHTLTKINRLLSDSVEAAKLIDYDLEITSNDIEDMCQSYIDSVESTMGYYSARWSLDDSSLNHLSKFLTDTDIELIVELATVITEDRYILRDGLIVRCYGEDMPRINLDTLEQVAKDTNSNNHYRKLIISQSEAQLDYVKSIFDRLSKVNN